jgi:hypothetical protein
MAQQDTNIALNLTGDGTPAVHRQNAPDASTDNNETATDPPVTNPDGSVTVYGTPPDDAGDTTTENVPQSPLAGEIAAFEQEMEHPEDWTDAERRAVGMQRLHPELSDSEISDRLDISTTVVGQARQKVALATLDGCEAVHAAFHDRTATQQTVLAACVRDPDRTTTDLAELADCAPGSAGSIRRRFKPLLRQLSDVGLPEEIDPPTDETATTANVSDSEREGETRTAQDDETDAAQAAAESFTCEICGATFGSKHARNGHKAVHTNEDEDASETDDEHTTTETDTTSASDGTRPAIDDIKRFVTGLRERATDDHHHSDAPALDQNAMRRMVCDAVLTYIETARATP